MTDDAEESGTADGSDSSAGTSAQPSGAAGGFSTTEKVVGAIAAYEHPLATGVATSAMLRTETDPTRRDQLTSLRDRAVLWWCIGAGVGVVVLVIVLIAVVHSGAASSSCKGGIDRFDATGVTYQSSDNKHWTATYPCNGGGSKTVPIARNKVPGGGG